MIKTECEGVSGNSSGHEHAVQCQTYSASVDPLGIYVAVQLESPHADKSKNAVATVGIYDMWLAGHHDFADDYFK